MEAQMAVGVRERRIGIKEGRERESERERGRDGINEYIL